MNNIKLFESFNKKWYHGTPDCRQIDKQGGFSDIKTSIEYVTDIDKFNSITEELPSLNETDYFKALNEISKLKDTYI